VRAFDAAVWRRSGWRWAAGAVLVVVAGAVLLLLHDPRYFFHGDTQAAYLGWEYRLGEELRAGRWPLLDPHAWAAGNAVADGQWGLFSPLLMGIGLLASVSSNVLLFATAVKIALLTGGALGAFLLARSYGATPPLAFVAAVAAPAGGMTQYVDLPSWTAGLMIWALLPWVWWALRRTTLGRANPAPVLVLGYLLVSVGYVYGTIMLLVVLAAALLEAAAGRDRAAVLRTLGVGVVCGLVACTVYLPGVLTAPVSVRSGGGIAWSGKFTSDPLALFTSPLPTAAAPGVYPRTAPFAYLAWFLPLVALVVDWRAVGRHWRPVAGLALVVGLMALVQVAAPARVGPLRWPMRLQPFLVQGVVVLAAVLVSRHAVRRPSRGRLAAGLAWVLLAGVAAGLRAPATRTGVAVAALLVAVAVAAGWAFARWSADRPGRDAWVRGGALVAAAATVALGVVQHGFFPDVPSPERHMPAHASDYRRPLPAARGDVLVVGRLSRRLQASPSLAREALAGSAWYLGRHPVVNLYTTVGNRKFRARYCTKFQGSTCPALLTTLFSTEPATGLQRVDLLAVSTVLVVRADLPARDLSTPPAGWRVAAATARTVTWVRREPVPGAGGAVWASPGTKVRPLSRDDRDVRFAVGAPPGGGRVVLSRLAWPGYRVHGGRTGPAVDGYLLTVDVRSGAHVVDVHFSPPGWAVEVAAWWLAVTGAVGWSVAVAVRSRRRSRT
jgi:hypothetical protein